MLKKGQKPFKALPSQSAVSGLGMNRKAPASLRTGKSLAELAQARTGYNDDVPKLGKRSREEIDETSDSEHVENPKTKRTKVNPFMQMVQERQKVQGNKPSLAAGMDQDDEEIAYLRRKLGLKSKADFGKNSKLRKEFEKDNMADFFVRSPDLTVILFFSNQCVTSTSILIFPLPPVRIMIIIFTYQFSYDLISHSFMMNRTYWCQ